MTAQGFGCIFQDRQAAAEPQVKCFALPTSFRLGCLVPSERAASAGTPCAFSNACLVPLHCTALQEPAARSGLKVCFLHLSQLSCWRRGTDVYRSSSGCLGWWLNYIAKFKSFVSDRKPLQGNLKALCSLGLRHRGAAPLGWEGRSGITTQF